ncbi:MAG: hypothetical protein K6A29_04225 [Lachnospiraceae bacterium]|nr:hypothetical protein [Lachnospiraceae bacterium]
MNKIDEILEYYIEWQSIVEASNYKEKLQTEKEQLRLEYDEDAKYFKGLGCSDETALHADVIIPFWTIYKTLLSNEANWNVSKTLKSLQALKRQVETGGRYSKRILAVNDLLLEFAEVCYTKGNYMLLPNGGRMMNNQRYQFMEDRIDSTLYQCFSKGLLSKFFSSDDAVKEWVVEQKLDKMFSGGSICAENVIWMTNAKSPKLISEMSTEEIMEYVQNAIHFIKERGGKTQIVRK